MQPSVGQYIVQKRADPYMTVTYVLPAFLQETSTWSNLLSVDFDLPICIPFYVNIAVGTGASSLEKTSFTSMSRSLHNNAMTLE